MSITIAARNKIATSQQPVPVVEEEENLEATNQEMTMVARSHSPPAVGTTTHSVFEVGSMPQIHRRTLYPWSVHCSISTGKWIATISRPEDNHVNSKVRHVQFPFATEREARKFCKAYAPPKPWGGSNCQLCDKQVSPTRHCRNCGVTVCDRCTTRWGHRMVPKTYSSNNTLTVRVCRSCDWLSNAFCMALLQGRYEDAVTLHQTGNVNLRTSFADIHSEAMFPVHCAVMGGSLELVKWLVETHLCPISVSRDPKTRRMLSVQTSACRTLMDLAMRGKAKADILRYLVQRGLSIHDTKDSTLAAKTLESLLKQSSGNNAGVTSTTTNPEQEVAYISNDIEMVDSFEESVATVEDACVICCEKQMDCALTPCGHIICCTECGQQLKNCPVCKVECSVLRIFRP